VHHLFDACQCRPAHSATSRNAPPVLCEGYGTLPACYSARRYNSRYLAAAFPGCRFYDCTWRLGSGCVAARGLSMNSPCCSPGRLHRDLVRRRRRLRASVQWPSSGGDTPLAMSRCQNQGAWNSRSSPRSQLKCLCIIKARVHKGDLSMMHFDHRMRLLWHQISDFIVGRVVPLNNL
jgi:hypothetical protein